MKIKRNLYRLGTQGAFIVVKQKRRILRYFFESGRWFVVGGWLVVDWPFLRNCDGLGGGFSNLRLAGTFLAF